jgi:hypothetical protein
VCLIKKIEEMVKNENGINDCLEKLKKLETEFNAALKTSDLSELFLLRQKIKQQNEKLRTVRRVYS